MAPWGTPVDEREIETILGRWPAEPTNVAVEVIESYGPPDQATHQRLFWFDNGPWKRTVMHRDGVPHKFPDTHIDYLEGVIDYRVPPKDVEKLARFDGSVTVRRTRGELSAECHGEPANYLALNLAHEIMSGERTVADARETYTRVYAEKEAGGRPDYITGFTFDLPAGEQRDPDERTLTEETERAATERVQS